MIKNSQIKNYISLFLKMENKNLLLEAKLYEKANEHEKAIEYMEKYIKNINRELTTDERNIFSLSCYNFINEKLNQWKKLKKIIEKEQFKDSDNELIFKYLDLKKILENQINEKCDYIINIIDKFLFENSETNESKITYLKLKGDYYRILSYILNGNAKDEAINNSKVNYKNAFELNKNLPNISLVKLSFILSYGIYYYEFLKDPSNAFKINNEAFDKAINEINNLNNNDYKEVSYILKLMKKNIEMWKKE